MDSVTIFAVLVLAIGICHLLWQSVEAAHKHLGKSQKSKQKSKKQIRDDWFLFFHRSALIQAPKGSGKTAGTKSTRPASSDRQGKTQSRRTVVRLYPR